MFRSLILSACLVGVALGLAMTAFQAVGTSPIILAAEQYESPEPVVHHTDHASHDHGEQAGGHQHGDDAWAPADGAERLFFTTISNVFAGIGFAAILLVLMNQLRERGRIAPKAHQGLLLGALGFLAVFVAPSIGLPPEIPGASAAALELRQSWWVVTVACAATGLGVLFLATGWKRLLGVPLLIAPQFFVPSHEGAVFANPDPEAVLALTELHHRFIWASGLANLGFWLLAGVLCALVLKRLSDTGRLSDANASA
ncbi:hypothetical protein EZI54_18355 [Marinobacter halodurans]|uniref:Cobalt transporter n=1 Tax=Marinobacter halodurans TaxID=2528979 RepID=A0ABY1ZK60_9GAMM|nr:CbtA family protein [Marinobacter halodurans]TBW50345.1 hypothetical protein EZI54_18355 [Marinobacter halodurans]